MLITGFEKKGRKVRVNFDNGNHMTLNYEIFLKNGLRLNENLTESRFAFLLEENLKFDIKQSAFNLLSRRLHSAAELSLKLRQKYHNPQIIDEVVEHLKENKYLDDEKFAAEFIAEKAKSRLWGSRKITSELKRRGIDYRIAGNEFINEHLEEGSELLKQAAEKKLKNLRSRNIDPGKIKQKLVMFLISRGYSYEEVKRTADLLLRDTTDDQQQSFSEE